MSKCGRDFERIWRRAVAMAAGILVFCAPAFNSAARSALREAVELETKGESETIEERVSVSPRRSGSSPARTGPGRCKAAEAQLSGLKAFSTAQPDLPRHLVFPINGLGTPLLL